MITRAPPEADSILVAHPVAVKVREGTGGGRNGLCRILEKARRFRRTQCDASRLSAD